MLNYQIEKFIVTTGFHTYTHMHKSHREEKIAINMSSQTGSDVILKIWYLHSQPPLKMLG